MHHFDSIYPFSAIVGQDRMKLALLLVAINPKIGGVLIRGEKGTAKSTAARALARLLPERQVVDGCPYGCDPAEKDGLCRECRTRDLPLPVRTARMRVVELPVSATEDKVVGSLDIGHALKSGEMKFEPGILAQAHRNILYVDEVNLLNDHIVDVLLDAAAMGVNFVEREGVSYAHPSAFILIGTMNPEEGELRPQLLDRFGLCAEIEGIRDAAARVDVIRRRQAYEADPEAFVRQWQGEERALRDRVVQAQALLPSVSAPDAMLAMIAQVCIDMAVDGHRADITMVKAAAALAAWNGRTVVEEGDVRAAADLVLPHRMRRRPFDSRPMDKQKMEESIRKSRQEQKQESGHRHDPPSQGEDGQRPDGSGTVLQPAGAPFAVDRQVLGTPRRTDPLKREGGGRRNATESRDGRYVRSRIPETIGPDIALDATIRAAAPFQRDRDGDLAVKIAPADLREKVREKKTGTTLLFVVDASGSMGAEARMTAVKGAILSLLVDAYQKRDRVGLVAFRGSGATVLLPPTSSVETAEEHLRSLPVGGKTPLAAGLMEGYGVLMREMLAHAGTIPRLVLVSDGRANVGLMSASPVEDAKAVAARIREAKIGSLVIDTEQGLIALGLAATLAGELGGGYVKLDDLRADRIATAVRGIGM